MIHAIKKSIAILSLLAVVACSNSADKPAASTPAAAKTDTTKIVIGSMGADSDIWRFIAKSPAAKEAGLEIEVKDINDGITLNNATAEGQVDVNAFQSWAYFKSFNQTNGDKLGALATTYLEPMGLYSKTHKDLNALPQGATVAIPNDTANTSRALRLLEEAKLITLKADFNPVTGTVQDIANNPKKLNIKLVQGASGPRVLGDVDLGAIGNTNALESGLNVTKDALFHEQVGDRVLNNINILATKKDRVNDAALQKLSALYHQPAVDAYIKEHFGGTKLDVNQPISSLN